MKKRTLFQAKKLVFIVGIQFLLCIIAATVWSKPHIWVWSGASEFQLKYWLVPIFVSKKAIFSYSYCHHLKVLSPYDTLVTISFCCHHLKVLSPFDTVIIQIIKITIWNELWPLPIANYLILTNWDFTIRVLPIIICLLFREFLVNGPKFTCQNQGTVLRICPYLVTGIINRWIINRWIIN